MHETKLKIDLNQGLLEIEGSEEFVRDLYDDFKDILKTRPQSASTISPTLGTVNATRSEQPSTKAKPAPKPKSKAKAKSKSSTDTTGKFLKDLNLMGDESSQSLRDFYGVYDAKTNFERTLIFVYYLENIRGISSININHIYTCYRDIGGLKIPGHLKQNLLDTSFKKGWLDTADMEDIKVPVMGVNYIEHDLLKKGDSE